jgi:hypothetical protein
MASRLLVGIFPSSDVASLEKALGDAPSIDSGRVRVVTAEPKSAAHDESFLSFTHVRPENVDADLSPDVTHGTGVITDFGGTGVPGTTDAHEALLSDFDEPEYVPDYLGTLPIPSDEAENYDEAISEGRSVVLYSASSDEEAAQAQQSLRAAGLRNIAAF